MKSPKFVNKLLVLLFSLSLLAACSGGGGGNDTNDTPSPGGSSNWDEMVWDQDNWS